MIDIRKVAENWASEGAKFLKMTAAEARRFVAETNTSNRRRQEAADRAHTQTLADISVQHGVVKGFKATHSGPREASAASWDKAFARIGGHR